MAGRLESARAGPFQVVEVTVRVEGDEGGET
jgi:hypothetical protein